MRILAVAGDAGGGRALIPVLRLLTSDDLDLRAYGPALGMWREAGFDARRPDPVSVAGIDRLLVSTSVGPEQWEVRYTRAARAARVPSVGVLDGWTNLEARFTAGRDELTFPDRIAVPDERAWRDLSTLTRDASEVIVTGHPALAGLLRMRSSVVERRASARQALGAHDGVIVTYVSQPINDLIPPDELGFHHDDVLPQVVDAIADLVPEVARPVLILVRPHPREAGRELRLPEARRSVRVRISPPLDVVETAAASDLIIGISSMFLLEASTLGARVIRYQPGLRIADPLPLSGYGWNRGVYTHAGLAPAIADALGGADMRATAELDAAHQHHGAANRIVELIRPEGDER